MSDTDTDTDKYLVPSYSYTTLDRDVLFTKRHTAHMYLEEQRLHIESLKHDNEMRPVKLWVCCLLVSSVVSFNLIIEKVFSKLTCLAVVSHGVFVKRSCVITSFCALFDAQIAPPHSQPTPPRWKLPLSRAHAASVAPHRTPFSAAPRLHATLRAERSWTSTPRAHARIPKPLR